MTFRALSCLITDPEDEHDTLQCARALATRFGAHLDLTCLSVDMTSFGGFTGAGAILPGDGLEQARAEAKDMEKRVHAALEGALDGVTLDHHATPQPLLDQVVARHARYTDLVVAAQPHGPGRSPLAAMVFEAALFGADAAMLVMPDELRSPPPFKKVVLAWDEGAEALRAIRRALPFITQAETIHIVMVDPPKSSVERSDPGGALSYWLSRHGARCQVSVLGKSQPRISDILMEFASGQQADLMVMGAYGHSRFREALVGGPTRDLLGKAPCPIFMSH